MLKVLKKSFAVVAREFQLLWRDSDLRRILFIVSILSLLLFFAVYYTRVLREIPTVVLDLDRTPQSLEMLQSIENCEDLNVVLYSADYKELCEVIEKGEAVVGVVIPENFGRDVAGGKGSKILSVIDGSNMIYANNAVSAVLTVARTHSAELGVKKLIARGVHYTEAQYALMGVVFRDEPWFNSTLNYAVFVVLAMALNVWQQCCTITATYNITGEMGKGSWLQIKALRVSKFLFFFSKSLAHIIGFMLAVIPLYIMAFGIYKMPLRCSPAELLLFTLVFAVSIHGLGTMISALCGDPVDAVRFGMVIALPSFILSGYTWPLEAMPAFVQKAAKFFPQTWFFQGFNLLVFKNPGREVLQPYVFVLMGMACLFYLLSLAAAAVRS
ncbi:MAG: ABC transporter permease [Clostridia bacterium]|nr:ABC transporter permease [Clostridia bacterium]